MGKRSYDIAYILTGGMYLRRKSQPLLKQSIFLIDELCQYSEYENQLALFPWKNDNE